MSTPTAEEKKAKGEAEEKEEDDEEDESEREWTGLMRIKTDGKRWWDVRRNTAFYAAQVSLIHFLSSNLVIADQNKLSRANQASHVENKNLQGIRESMEDRMSAVWDDASPDKGEKELQAFAIFDGHGGASVATYLESVFLKEVIQEIRTEERRLGGEKPDVAKVSVSIR